MAKAYIRENKTQLKLLEANNAKLTKPRKTKIQARYKAKWEGEIVEAKKQLKGKILFEGYSLDKLCKGLGVQLKHHNALSDAKAIIPIYDFFTEKSSQDQE